jgi:hypothetical protein
MWSSTAAVGFTVLSWNTLSYDDAWADGWGTPLEQDRRDCLMLLENLSIEEAQDILTSERYQRIRRDIMWEELMSADAAKPFVDLLLFQELNRDAPWDEPEQNVDVLFSTTLSTLYDRIPCQDSDEYNTTTMRRVYVRKNSGWTVTRSFGLETDVLQGGCLVELEYLLCEENDDEEAEDTHIDDCKEVDSTDEHNKLYIVNLHGKSGDMRNPEVLAVGMPALWNEISNLLRPSQSDDELDDPDFPEDSWKERIVLCGDWNVHMTDLPGAFAGPGRDPTLVAAILNNQTATNFSTNHEAGFLTQYDGCLLANSSVLHLDSVSRNLHGFMVKGEQGELTGGFSYEHNQGVLYDGALLPGTLASDGLSDHLRIYTTFSVAVGIEDSTNPGEPGG